jgi:hypothetical protein
MGAMMQWRRMGKQVLRFAQDDKTFKASVQSKHSKQAFKANIQSKN